MTDEEMVACYADADVCVFGENYEKVSIGWFKLSRRFTPFFWEIDKKNRARLL